jgi:hypothetical protein
MLSGSIGFDPATMTHAEDLTLSEAWLELVPRRGFVDAQRAVKDERLRCARRARSPITTNRSNGPLRWQLVLS